MHLGVINNYIRRVGNRNVIKKKMKAVMERRNNEGSFK